MVSLRYLAHLIKRELIRVLGPLNPWRQQRQIDALYSLLYQLSHDLEEATELSSVQTADAFAYQWQHLEDGQYLLTDPWFKNNVARIIWEEELQMKAEWFRGKDVLDAGCGNGRWSFGLAELGVKLTAIDINDVALEKT